MNPDMLCQKRQSAIHAYEQKNFDESRKVCEEILCAFPADSSVLHLLGCVYLELGESDKAVSFLLASTKENHSDHSPWAALGIAYYRSCQFQKAIEALRESLARNEANPEAWLFFGASFREIGDNKKAIMAYQNALQLKPDYSDASMALACLLAETGEKFQAASVYRNAIQISPGLADAYSSLGYLLSDEGDGEESILLFRKALKLDPGNVAVLSQLAILLYRRGEYREAISLFRKALDLDPAHVNSKVGLGGAFLISGRHNEAKEYYARLLQSNPGDPDALFFLFQIFKSRVEVGETRQFCYASQFLAEVSSSLGVSKFVAFGDSHVLLFRGVEDIEVNHVGASTAYGLLRQDSSTGGRQKVLARISAMNPEQDAVLLCFGEVDVRANIVKYCYQAAISIDQCVVEVVSRYIEFASEIAAKGFRVIIYGGYGAGTGRLAIGSDSERNYAAHRLHCYLMNACKEREILYFSLHDFFFSAASLSTASAFLEDGFHLHSDGDSLKQIQLLLFSSMYKAVDMGQKDSSMGVAAELVLANVGCSDSVFALPLGADGLKAETCVEEIKSLTFDLGAFIACRHITFVFDVHFSSFPFEFLLDNRPIAVGFSRSNDDEWRVASLEESSPLIGRYPALLGCHNDLLSVKFIDFEKLNLSVHPLSEGS